MISYEIKRAVVQEFSDPRAELFILNFRKTFTIASTSIPVYIVGKNMKRGLSASYLLPMLAAVACLFTLLLKTQDHRDLINSSSSWDHEPSRDGLQPMGIPPAMVNLSQEDPVLIRHIRHNWIMPPSAEPRMLNQPGLEHYSQIHQSRVVDEILGGLESGFYVECGAGDGETFSNSLFFEKSRGWKGLLVEANPSLFKNIQKRHRHAHSLNACLSPTRYSAVLNFTTAHMAGGLQKFMESSHGDWIDDKNSGSSSLANTAVPCFPLFSVLSALEITHVDYFSLDVEGAELDILKTIPFDKITFGVMTIEYHVVGCPECSGSKFEAIQEFLTGTGLYKMKRTIGVLDAVFVPI